MRKEKYNNSVVNGFLISQGKQLILSNEIVFEHTRPLTKLGVLLPERFYWRKFFGQIRAIHFTPTQRLIYNLAAHIIPKRLWIRHPMTQFRKAKAGKCFRDRRDCPEMFEIPMSYYLIGSPLTKIERFRHVFIRWPIWHELKYLSRERSSRWVRIASPFALSVREVTFAGWESAQLDPDWQKIIGRPALMIDFEETDCLSRPVTQIDQNDARALAVRMRATTGYHIGCQASLNGNMPRGRAPSCRAP